MLLGDFEVTCSAVRSPAGGFVAVARVQWSEQGVAHHQDWTFKGYPCQTEAEALIVAEARVGELFAHGQLGNQNASEGGTTGCDPSRRPLWP